MRDERFRAVFLPVLGVPAKSFYSCEYVTFREAEDVLTEIADYTLYIQGRGLMDDLSNVGWIERLTEDGWEEYEK